MCRQGLNFPDHDKNRSAIWFFSLFNAKGWAFLEQTIQALPQLAPKMRTCGNSLQLHGRSDNQVLGENNDHIEGFSLCML